MSVQFGNELISKKNSQIQIFICLEWQIRISPCSWPQHALKNLGCLVLNFQKIKIMVSVKTFMKFHWIIKEQDIQQVRVLNNLDIAFWGQCNGHAGVKKLFCHPNILLCKRWRMSLLNSQIIPSKIPGSAALWFLAKPLPKLFTDASFTNHDYKINVPNPKLHIQCNFEIETD